MFPKLHFSPLLTCGISLVLLLLACRSSHQSPAASFMLRLHFSSCIIASSLLSFMVISSSLPSFLTTVVIILRALQRLTPGKGRGIQAPTKSEREGQGRRVGEELVVETLEEELLRGLLRRVVEKLVEACC